MSIQSPISVFSDGQYTDLPMPTENGYVTTPQEITKSSRNAVGTLYKYRIAVKQTITAKWGTQTPADKNTILRLTGGNSMNLKYFDTSDGEYKFGKFYRGNDLKIIPIIRFDGSEFTLYNIEMSLIEF